MHKQPIDPYEPRTGIDFYSEVAPRIILPINCPYLIYGIGVARNGTTALLNVMTSSKVENNEATSIPVQCGYQQFKAGYRHAMHNWPNDTDTKKWHFEVPDASISPVLYLKDTLGPYTKTESTYNPIKLLKMINYPKDKLFLLFFSRSPNDVLASWKKNWGEVRKKSVLRENLITAYSTLRDIHDQAVNDGYAYDIFLYESLRDYPPETIIKTLFNKINNHMTSITELKLSMTTHSVGDWDKEVIKNIWQPDEPSIYTRPEIDRLHIEAKTKSKLSYKGYSPEDLLRILSHRDITILNRAGVYNDYDHFRLLFTKSSGLEILHPEGINRLKQEGASGERR